jgi:hypothetical protein
MKVDWQAAAVVVFIVAALIGWGVSVEVRLAQHAGVETLSQRIKNIEDLMTPVLVDWKVQQELRKYGVMVAPTPMSPTPSPDPPVLPVVPGPPKRSQSEIEKDAQKWAKEQVQQRPINN